MDIKGFSNRFATYSLMSNTEMYIISVKLIKFYYQITLNQFCLNFNNI